MRLLVQGDGDDSRRPPPPATFSLPPPLADLSQHTPPRDWPHAPVHRLTGHGVYIVTAGTLHKHRLFDAPGQRDLLEGLLLGYAKHFGWQLEAWAVFANHYHFVARDTPGAAGLRTFVSKFHSESARQLNRLEAAEGRAVWHEFWDTRLTYPHAYLARLNYAHQNPVRFPVEPGGWFH